MCPALLVVDLASHGPGPLLRYFPPRGPGHQTWSHMPKRGNRLGARMCVQSPGGYIFRKLIIALIAAAALSITAFAAIAPPAVAPPAVAPVTAPAVIPVTATAVGSTRKSRRARLRRAG